MPQATSAVAAPVALASPPGPGVHPLPPAPAPRRPRGIRCSVQLSPSLGPRAGHSASAHFCVGWVSGRLYAYTCTCVRRVYVACALPIRQRAEACLCGYVSGHCLVGEIPPPSPPKGEGGVRDQNKVCVPQIGLQFPAPLTNFIASPRKIALMCVGGSVGRGCPGPQTTPPPPPRVTNPWLYTCIRVCVPGLAAKPDTIRRDWAPLSPAPDTTAPH